MALNEQIVDPVTQYNPEQLRAMRNQGIQPGSAAASAQNIRPPSGPSGSQADFNKLSEQDQAKVIQQARNAPGWAKTQFPEWLQQAIAQPETLMQQLQGMSPQQQQHMEDELTKPATPATPTNATTPAPGSTTSPTGQPLFNPMAVNAFYASAIAPLMNQLQGNLANENAGYTQQAQNAIGQYDKSLPAGMRTIMDSMPAQMGAAQNDVIAALMAASASGPAFDALNRNISNAGTASEAAYRQMMTNPGVASSYAQALNAAPAGTSAQAGNDLITSIIAGLPQNQQPTANTGPKVPDPTRPGYNTDGTLIGS